MPAVNIRNIPEAIHRALKLQAVQHGRSTESEIRAILKAAVLPKTRVKIGAELAAFGQQLGDFNFTRYQIPTEPAVFE